MSQPQPELRLPVAVVVVVVVVLQVALPDQYLFGTGLALPVLELVLLGTILALDGRHIDRDDRLARSVGLLLVGVMTLATAATGVTLIRGLLNGTVTNDPQGLLLTGGAIWVINVSVFALWYWELDRGGSVARFRGSTTPPDFLFPQMTSPEYGKPGWRPVFVDYLYTSFTNATAFSPTDAMPLRHRTKLLMALQAAVSLLTVVLVIARAINILR